MNYHKKITGKMYSAIEGVCYQSEIISLIEKHSILIKDMISVICDVSMAAEEREDR